MSHLSTYLIFRVAYNCLKNIVMVLDLSITTQSDLGMSTLHSFSKCFRSTFDFELPVIIVIGVMTRRCHPVFYIFVHFVRYVTLMYKP